MKIEKAFFLGAALVGFSLAATSAEALTVTKPHSGSSGFQRSTFWVVEHEKKPKARHVHKAKKHASWHKPAKSHHKLAKKD